MKVRPIKTWKITEIFKENNGQLSSTRVLLLAWGFTTLIMWVIMSWVHQTIMPIPETNVYLMLGFISGKVVQKYGESAVAALTNAVAPQETDGAA